MIYRFFKELRFISNQQSSNWDYAKQYISLRDIYYANYMILLYDDDCGICAKYSKIIGRLRPTMPILPMHDEKLIAIGTRKIGSDKYWQSFHMINNGTWTTESSAITELAKVFPAGRILGKITTVQPVKYLLLKFLNIMQNKRKIECELVK